MHRRIIRIAAQGLAAILLVTLLAACGAPPRSEGPAPTPIPTLIPVAQATATPAPQSATGQPGQGRGPARRPAADTTLATFTTADFSGAGLCAACHMGLKDEAGADVSMPTAWRSTMMGERRQGSGLAGQGQLGGGALPGAASGHREEVRHLPHADGRDAGRGRGPAGDRAGGWLLQPGQSAAPGGH